MPATIKLRANEAKPSTSGFSVVFHLTDKADPFPPRDVIVKTTAEALAALDAYKREAATVGTPMAISMRVKDGDRAPNGFKAANNRFYHPVNI